MQRHEPEALPGGRQGFFSPLRYSLKETIGKIHRVEKLHRESEPLVVFANRDLGFNLAHAIERDRNNDEDGRAAYRQHLYTRHPLHKYRKDRDEPQE